jgi:hypothetical protein
MIYERQIDLIQKKEQLGLTNLDLARVLICAPSTASAKLGGYCQLSQAERKRLMDYFKTVEGNRAVEIQA